MFLWLFLWPRLFTQNGKNRADCGLLPSGVLRNLSPPFLSEIPSAPFTLFPCQSAHHFQPTLTPLHSHLVLRGKHFDSSLLRFSLLTTFLCPLPHFLIIPFHRTLSLTNPPICLPFHPPPCRYKHFDWLYARLVERFPVISVPHLPEKQATGRFEEDFISKRRKGLIWWMNHMISHPVLARCDVFQHFLTCGADEKAWKQGKRKAERDELVGANFFLTIR